MHKLTLLLFLFSLLCGTTSFAQRIAGKITDENDETIAYATVYAPAAATGVLTDEEGNFTIDLKQIPDSSKLQFSCIGYETRVLTAGDVRDGGVSRTIQLTATNYVLSTAEVAAARIEYKRKRLGMPGIMNGTYLYRPSAERRVYEIGTILTPDKSARLEEVIIRVRSMKADSVLLDINIYDVNLGLVGAPLLRERIFLRLGSEDVRKDINVDLSAQRIQVDRAFLVTFRVLDVVGLFDGINLAAKTGYGRGFARASDGRWKDTYMTPNIRARVGYAKE
ncbi:carboxypeptidase-like regulatory domain-containing protein [Neolewinella antarctica]|uniref:Carboxypeptidase-like regulatory domain-containing protein n=1 Tax=Neolewinella antarctica TaxID=442734 RepID=A0ABX0XCI6_9BACT|nr:carboxypeptidase-like regulatory domain-containing protein [Neolewinella antarctica]NJC26994.1 hypothetical protein [Neolewinella antarctica]